MAKVDLFCIRRDFKNNHGSGSGQDSILDIFGFLGRSTQFPSLSTSRLVEKKGLMNPSATVIKKLLVIH